MLFPVLYSTSLLFIYFIHSSVYMLIPNCKFIPLLPSPLVTISFSVCESIRKNFKLYFKNYSLLFSIERMHMT